MLVSGYRRLHTVIAVQQGAVRRIWQGGEMTQPLASVSVSQSFQNLLDTVMHSIPKILVFLAVLIIGWIIARVVQKLVVTILHRVHFDRFAERGVVGDALKRSNYDASMLIGKILYYCILLIALQIAFGVFGNNPVSTMLNAIVGWLPKAIVAIVLIVVASAIAKVVKDLLNGMLGGLSYGGFIASAASILIIVIGAFAALDQIGIANQVTNPVLYTGLATVGAILAIGVGGGAIKPMQERWERILTGAERETTRQISAYQRGRQDAMNAPAPETVQQQTDYGQGDYGQNP
jgi:small-conductance mechanosensitive channel